MTVADPAREVVRLERISKSFGLVPACQNVDFSLRSGEVHVLLGENGAGKTTLMNIMFGGTQPDSGQIHVRDEPVSFHSPGDALALGIGMVHQHFSLVGPLSVAENIALGSTGPWASRLKVQDYVEPIAKLAEEVGLEVDPAASIQSLTIPEKQQVEIVKLLYRGASVLILDEPTASLGPSHIDSLFRILIQLKDAGRSIVLITHKLSEATDIADRITVLRRGKVVDRFYEPGFDHSEIARAMIGHELEAASRPAASTVPSGDAALIVDKLAFTRTDGQGFGHASSDGMTITVYPGEIVGVGGVEGNGQDELVNALSGIGKIASGRILIEGREATAHSPAELRARGVRVIPDDRQEWGLVGELSVAENLLLPRIARGEFQARRLLRRRAIRAEGYALMQEFDIRPLDPALPAAALSGGNQQKVVIGRELSDGPTLLVASNPTRGVDFGATDFIWRRLIEAKQSGVAVLLVTNDLDELLAISDRIVVLFRGEVVYRVEAAEVDFESLSAAMAGVTREFGGVNAST